MAWPTLLASHFPFIDCITSSNQTQPRNKHAHQDNTIKQHQEKKKTPCDCRQIPPWEFTRADKSSKNK